MELSRKAKKRYVRWVVPTVRRPKGCRGAREHTIYQKLGEIRHCFDMLEMDIVTFEDYLAELPCYAMPKGRLRLAAWRNIRSSREMSDTVRTLLRKAQWYYTTAEARQQRRAYRQQLRRELTRTRR